jgi:hypothetical protein
MSDSEQKSLGHDLVKTFRESLARGFRPTDLLQSKLVDEINPHYKDMSLRYQIGESVDLPLLKDAICVTWLLMKAVHQQCTTKYE